MNLSIRETVGIKVNFIYRSCDHVSTNCRKSYVDEELVMWNAVHICKSSYLWRANENVLPLKMEIFNTEIDMVKVNRYSNVGLLIFIKINKLWDILVFTICGCCDILFKRKPHCYYNECCCCCCLVMVLKFYELVRSREALNNYHSKLQPTTVASGDVRSHINTNH